MNKRVLTEKEREILIKIIMKELAQMKNEDIFKFMHYTEKVITEQELKLLVENPKASVERKDEFVIKAMGWIYKRKYPLKANKYFWLACLVAIVIWTIVLVRL